MVITYNSYYNNIIQHFAGIISTQRVEGKINKNNVSLTVTNLPQNNKNNT